MDSRWEGGVHGLVVNMHPAVATATMALGFNPGLGYVENTLDTTWYFKYHLDSTRSHM